MNIRASRGPACGPSASRWESSCSWSGSSWPGGSSRSASSSCSSSRCSGRATSPRSRVRRRDGPSPRPLQTPTASGRCRRGRARPRTRPPSYTREKFLEATTLGLGAVIGALVTVPVLGFTVLPGVPQPGRGRPRPRAARELPRGRMEDRDVPDRPEAGDVSRISVFVRYNGVVSIRRRRSPSRASRSSPTTACISAARCSRTGRRPSQPQEGRRRDDDPDAAVELRLPVPRRPVRHRGQPHRRPARPRARPLPVLGRAPAPLPRHPVLGLPGRGHRRRRREIYKWNKRSPACTSTGPSPGSTRSSRPADGDAHDATPAQQPQSDPVSARLARRAVGPRRRDPLLPLPQRPGRHQLVPDARLGDADRLHRPGD